jgi:hypothetical protein
MTITIAIILILILLFILLVYRFLIPVGMAPYKNKDHNYHAIMKLFFAVNPTNFQNSNLPDSSKVLGLLIETRTEQNEKVILAIFISGFAGFYTVYDGGIIGGKKYFNDNNVVQQELIEMCNSKSLNGKFQTRNTKVRASNIVKGAYRYIDHTMPYSNSYDIPDDSTGLWFLTKNGFRCAVVKNTLISNSLWNSLIYESLLLIKSLKISNHEVKIDSLKS